MITKVDFWNWLLRCTFYRSILSCVHQLVTVSSSLSLLWCKLHCDMEWAVCKIIWLPRFCWIWLVRCWLTNKYTICVLTRLPPGTQITLQVTQCFHAFLSAEKFVCTRRLSSELKWRSCWGRGRPRSPRPSRPRPRPRPPPRTPGRSRRRREAATRPATRTSAETRGVLLDLYYGAISFETDWNCSKW